MSHSAGQVTVCPIAEVTIGFMVSLTVAAVALSVQGDITLGAVFCAFLDVIIVPHDMSSLYAGEYL